MRPLIEKLWTGKRELYLLSGSSYCTVPLSRLLTYRSYVFFAKKIHTVYLHTGKQWKSVYIYSKLPSAFGTKLPAFGTKLPAFGPELPVFD